MSAVAHPLTLEALLDYWLAELPPAQADALEEHLFECAECGERLDAVRALGDAIVGLVRKGELTGRATTALLNRFARDRLNVRQYTVAPGEVVACTVSPHDDLLMARLVVPEGTPGPLEIAVLGDQGQEVMRVEDVAYDPRAGEIMAFLPARPVQPMPSGRRQYVLLAGAQGQAREIARYTLDHTAMRDA
jgi:hypothetical protein